MKNKMFVFLIAIFGLFLNVSAAHAGTCNASYVDSLPHPTGSCGALPPSSPGQTAPGYITYMAGNGSHLDVTYTPNVGSPVSCFIDMGPGVTVTGFWGGVPGSKVQSIQFNSSGNTTQMSLNMQTWQIQFAGIVRFKDFPGATWTGSDGLGMIWATGDKPQNISFGGYRTPNGSNWVATSGMQGSCTMGPPTYSSPDASLDDANNLYLNAYATPGMLSAQFFVDGVSVGTVNYNPSFPFQLAAPTISVGRHQLYVIGTFSQGTYWQTAADFTYSPVKVSVGNSFACAVKANGTAACWGTNMHGRLGAGLTSATSDVPVMVQDGVFPNATLIYVTDISAGNEAACAVTDGGVRCWGKNTNGILGVAPGTLASSNVPKVVIAAGAGVVDVEVGGKHACARYSNNNMKCWGYGGDGQLGNSSFNATNITPVLSGTNVTKIAVARNTSYALIGSDIWAFGDDTYGQLGNGSPLADSSVGIKIITGGATDIGAGWYHACSLVSGAFKCWGSNDTSEVGIGTIGGTVNSPVVATAWNGFTVTSFIGGDGTTCAKFSTNEVKCLGYNAYGQLGFGQVSSEEISVVTPLGYITGVIQMAAGPFNICAYDNGDIKCAGDNTADQIGDPGANNPQLTPFIVQGF